MKPLTEHLSAHPAVTKVVQMGYSILYDYRDHGRLLDFVVTHGGRPAGNACFGLREATKEVVCETIEVFERHRRRGVGTVLYVCAGLLTKFTVRPAANQTDDGRAFWNQPTKPW